MTGLKFRISSNSIWSVRIAISTPALQAGNAGFDSRTLRHQIICLIRGNVLMVGYIYYISNTVNDKLYVGKTLSSIEKRFQEHCRDSRKRRMEHRPLYNAMRKYGEDKFSIHLLEEVDASSLAEREIYWIQKLNVYKNGYNGTHGGEGKILYGEDFTEAFINDFESGMPIRNIMKKYHCSKEVIVQRLRDAGFDTKQNMVHNRVMVEQYDRDGNFIQLFQSITEAAKYLVNVGLSSTTHGATVCIVKVAQGTSKTCGGFVWKYANE